MVLFDFSQTFLFTFRHNGQAHGKSLAEVSVHQLIGNDLCVAPDAYTSSWFGTDEALRPMLVDLGFQSFDVDGVMAALRSHRDCDRKLEITPNRLHAAGFEHVSLALA